MQLMKLGSALAAAVMLPATMAMAEVEANLADVTAALQRYGVVVEESPLSDGDIALVTHFEGVKSTIFFYGCDAGTVNNCHSVQFFAGFITEDPFPLARINEWNRDRRFGRAYVDDENDPVIEMDVNLDGGTTAANFHDTIDWWRVVATTFRTFVHE